MIRDRDSYAPSASEIIQMAKEAEALAARATAVEVRTACLNLARKWRSFADRLLYRPPVSSSFGVIPPKKPAPRRVSWQAKSRL
jgi:hypothetical protein